MATEELLTSFTMPPPEEGTTMDMMDIFSEMTTFEPIDNSTLSGEERRKILNTNIVLATIIGICCVLGIFGNSLVVITWAMSKKLQTITNIFVVSLSITDFLGCAMLPIQVMAFVNFDSGCPVPGWLCRMCGALCLIAFKSSVVHLALIGINRVLVITTFRARYMRMYNTRNVIFMVLFAWIFPILLIMLPPAAGFGWLGYNVNNQLCVFDGTPQQLRIIYIFEEILFGFSFIIIVGCYVKIYHFINRQHRDLIHIYSKRENSIPKLSIPPNLVEESCSEYDTDPATLTVDIDTSSSRTPPSPHRSTSSPSPRKQESTEKDPITFQKRKESSALAQKSPSAPSCRQKGSVYTPTSPKRKSSAFSSNSSKRSSTAYSNTKRRSTKSSEAMRTVITKREIDITKNLFVVVCSFFVFVFPHICCLMTEACYTYNFKYTATILVINSCSNPVIYCLKHPTFKEVSSCLFRGKFSRIPQPSRWLKNLLKKYES